MLEFNKKIFVAFFALVVATLVGVTAGVMFFFQKDSLLPVNESVIPWYAVAVSDKQAGGSSAIEVHDVFFSLDYMFTIAEDFEYPYASLVLKFDSPEKPHELMDFSSYSALTFRVKCEPKNILSFVVYAFDDRLTTFDDQLSYRVPTAFFPCEENWTDVYINLRDMKVPDWWLRYRDVDLFDNGYQREKVLAIVFGISPQTHRSVRSNVKIETLALHKFEYRIAVFFGALIILAWLLILVWCLRFKVRCAGTGYENVPDRSMATGYQKLNITSQWEKERNVLLCYMARDYTNPDLSLELAAKQVGMNRTKINDILKGEHGETFSVFLNRLRLAEAGRLLNEGAGVSISEIAYSIGYNNVSYFNKLFKNEYGRTPREFKLCGGSNKTDFSTDKE